MKCTLNRRQLLATAGVGLAAAPERGRRQRDAGLAEPDGVREQRAAVRLERVRPVVLGADDLNAQQIAIEQPLEDGRAIQAIVGLTDQAMASSGDYRIFYREDGRRISHTIDPRTGRPVENGPAATTVIATSAAEADAWATALMVIGEEDGLALTEEWDIAALVLVRGEGDVIEAKTNALFPPTIDPTPPTP